MPSSHIPSKPSTTMVKSAMLPSRAVYQPPFYYQFIIGLLKPIYRLQVWRRSHKRDNYQQEVAQRFGKHYPSPPKLDIKADMNNKVIWCHAVSLGETNTVAPLLDMLLAHGYQIWLTNTTQTGFARGASRFAADIAQGRLSHSYVPVDSPAVIETFLAHVQPIAALFVETELWANILTKLSEHRIPSILVNGRLSASSFKSYQKIAAVSASMMKNLTLIIAQDNESAKRFRQLGAHSAQIRVAGSLKWVINSSTRNNKATDGKAIDIQATDIEADIKIDIKADEREPEHGIIQKQKDDIAVELGIADRPIWVAASTHNGEESIALSLQQQLLSNPALADTLLIIVPRHPERFDEVAELIQNSQLIMARRSNEDVISTDTQVYLADSMGELMTWYTLADVALVGGSLVDVGGHNPVEPASVATPVLMGHHTQSCQSVVDKLASVGALYQPNNEFYRPVTIESITIENIAANSSDINNSEVSSSDVNSSDIKNEQVDGNDTALIYQQLQSWLNHLPLAKQAGQAGEQMTVQQQAVLTRQFTMIEKVIEQHSSQETL